MRYDTKIAVVVRDDLAVWQKLNVACFLSGGLAGQSPEVIGEPYTDADGRRYGSLIRQPILVFQADRGGLTRALQRPANRDVRVSIYTAELFATGNDADNRAALRAGDCHVVPRGIEHCPVAEEEAWVMFFEPAETKHTGDVDSELARPVEQQLSHLR